jgi:hypothetical protein
VKTIESKSFPIMAKTYGQLQDGIKNWGDFQKKVADELSPYFLLNWRTKKTLRLVKMAYNKGYTVSDAVSPVILNS